MIRIVFLTTIMLAVLFVGYIMVGSLPGATISVSKMRKIQAVSIFPEGWAFFTKDPQEEDYILYSFTRNSDGKYERVMAPTSAPQNIFGLNRASRLQAQELGAAIHYIKDSLWVTIKGSIDSSYTLVNNIKPVPIPIRSKHPYFNGKYIIQKTAPVPWAWAKDYKPEYGKSKIAIIEFKIPQQQVR